MKKLLSILVFMLSLLTFSKDYYIGDKISLKIKGDLSQEEIDSSFEEYKVYSIDKENNEYIVSFTSYEVGENLIKIGDKNLKFNMLSTLTEEDKEIHKDLLNPLNKIIEKDYPYESILFFVIGIIITLLAVIKIIYDFYKKPENIFKRDMKKVNDDNWQEQLSLNLRSYFDNKFDTNFLNGKYYANSYISGDDILFLKEIDILKYSKNNYGDTKSYINRANKIVFRIKKEVKNGI